jgi:hypothetical protein
MNRFYQISTQNQVVEKSVQIAKSDLDNVDESYYATTVFNSRNEFQKSMKSFDNFIFGSIRRKIHESPLIPDRGATRRVLFPRRQQGVAFTFYLNDYRTNRPLLTVVVDKNEEGYYYNSAVYDAETKDYVDRTQASIAAQNTSELLQFVTEKLNQDIDEFTGIPTV